MTSSRNGWDNVPLTEVLDFQEGPGIMAKDFRESGVPLVRVAGLKRQTHLLTGCNYLDPDMVSTRWAHFRLMEGDVLLSTSASLGETATVTSDGVDAIPYTGIIRFRPRGSAILPAFIAHALTSPSFKAQIEAEGSGSVIRHFGPSHLRRMTVVVPPLEEQKAIAEVLGALDDKIAANERRLETLNKFCSAWHERIINRANIDTPPHTLIELVKREFITLGDGYRTKQSEHGKPGLPILRVADIGHGAIAPKFTHFVSNSYRAAMGPKVSQRGDVVLTTKGTVGRVAIIESDQPQFVYSPQVCYFRLADNSPVSPHYLLHWFQGKEFWSQAGGLKGQTDMADYLSLRDIRSLRITVPTPANLAEFSRVCDPMQEQSEATRRENDTLASLRDTLLPQLVTGKIRVKDAERIAGDAT
ncbi:restriction endonuclease subunit S [Streptomyces sp. NPDC059477]|uniref:restriction endonuclease subunit S n=1 Tax=Streptomyces sp. NPDC059477 TaxID=3346847 RepID=UPI00368A6D13